MQNKFLAQKKTTNEKSTILIQLFIGVLLSIFFGASINYVDKEGGGGLAYCQRFCIRL